MQEKPKRKRKPQQRQRRQSSSIFVVVLMLLIAILSSGTTLLIVLIISEPEISDLELTVTLPIDINETSIALGLQTATAAAQQPTITPTPTFQPSATPLPTFTPTPTNVTPNVFIDETNCTWIQSTRIDHNGATPRVQQVIDNALLPADIRVMVHLAGDECLGPDELLSPNFVPLHTDYHLIARVDDRFLNDNIENDVATREQLGLLIRQIFIVLEDNFPPEATVGDEPGFIFMTFINGDVIRYTRTTFDVLARHPYRDYARGTAVISTAGELYK